MTNTRAEHTAELVDAWLDLIAAEGMRDTYRMMWQIESDNGRAKDAELARLRATNASLREELRATYERAVS